MNQDLGDWDDMLEAILNNLPDLPAEETLPTKEDIGKASWGDSTQTFHDELSDVVKRCRKAFDSIYRIFSKEREFIRSQFKPDLEAAILNGLSFNLSTILGIRDQLDAKFSRILSAYRCFIYAMKMFSLCYQRQQQLVAIGVDFNPLILDIDDIHDQRNKILSFIFDIDPEMESVLTTYEVARRMWDYRVNMSVQDFDERTKLRCYKTECAGIERLIYEKFFLAVTQQPEQVMQTGQTKKARKNPIKIRSLNFCGNKVFVSNTHVQTYLINESTAERISDGLQPDLDLAGSLELAGKMNFANDGAGITAGTKRKRPSTQIKYSVVAPYGRDIKSDAVTTKNSLFSGLKIEFQNNLKNSTYLDTEIPLTITEVLRDNLRKAKVGENEDSEIVAGQKYCFLFVAELQTRIGNVTTWTTSLPLIVSTHSSHSEKAWAAIVQDNAFPAPERKSFKVRERVHWEQFSELLENLFKKWVGSERLLEQSHLESIRNKLSSHIIKGNDGDNSKGKIEWAKILGKGNKDDSESFWSYFYRAVLIVNCPHLKGAWNKKYIDGFMSFEEAYSKLLSVPIEKRKPGTFIVRFSESEPGSITLVYISSDEISWIVSRMDPIEFYKSKSLDQCCSPFLAQLNSTCEIYRQEYFKCVYPAIPKETAFKNFYDHARKLIEKKNKENNKGKNGPPYVKVRSVLDTNEGHRDVVRDDNALGERNANANDWQFIGDLEPIQ